MIRAFWCLILVSCSTAQPSKSKTETIERVFDGEALVLQDHDFSKYRDEIPGFRFDNRSKTKTTITFQAYWSGGGAQLSDGSLRVAGTCFYQEKDASRTVAIELNDLAEDHGRVRSRYYEKPRFVLIIHKSAEPISREDFDAILATFRRDMCSFDLEPFAESKKRGRSTYHLAMNQCGFGIGCEKRNPVEHHPKRAFRKPYSFFLLNSDNEILLSGWAD